MKTITVNVSEPVYRAFQHYARSNDRTTSELLREAMAVYCETRIKPGGDLRALQPLNLGGIKKPLKPGDDLLDEMLND